MKPLQSPTAVPLVSFNHLTINSGHDYPLTDYGPATIDEATRAPIVSLGWNAIPGNERFCGLPLSIFLSRHSEVHYCFSIHRGEMPIVTCHACLDDAAVPDVWASVLMRHREAMGNLQGGKNENFSGHLSNDFLCGPPLRMPARKFLVTWISWPYDPCISWIAGFDQGVYWTLWHQYANG